MQICTLANSQHVSKSEWRLCSAGMTRVKQNDKVIIFSSVGKAVLTAQLKPPECHDKMCSISNVPKLKKMCALKLTNWRFWCTVFVQQMTLQGTRMNSTTHTHTHTHTHTPYSGMYCAWGTDPCWQVHCCWTKCQDEVQTARGTCEVLAEALPSEDETLLNGLSDYPASVR